MNNKSAQNRDHYKSLIDRGYVEINSTLYPPAQVELLIQNGMYVPKKKERAANRIKTGWVDDTLNVKNKANITDPFIALVLRVLGLVVWPEFYFLLDKQYRFDYAIPVDAHGRVLKIAIEQQGGIWAKGNSGHSSGTGIARDMDKATRAAVSDWTLIQRTPDQLCSDATIALIRESIKNTNTISKHD